MRYSCVMFGRLLTPVVLAILLCIDGAAVAQTPSATVSGAKHQASGKLIYINHGYCFRLTLPADWKGYAVLYEKWDGPLNDDRNKSETGPIIIIRNPLWTEENPYQDISIMVFTKAQWKDLEAGDFAVSAAPTDPGVLGTNAKYVFALPPRFLGFTDDLGQEEVGEWISGNPLHAY